MAAPAIREDIRGARAGAVLALLLTGAIVLWANLATPLWGDDWCRAGLTGLSEAVEATAGEYLNWSGRVAPTLLTYLALGPARLPWLPWLELANTLAFLGLVVLSMRLVERATGRAGTEGGFATGFASWAAACLLMWWLPRAIGEVALWKTGAIGYVWAVALALAVVERALAFAAAPPRGVALGAMALVALAAATFLEPLSAVTTGVLALVALRAARGAAPGRIAAMVLAGAHAGGTLVLMAAPGNFARAAAMEGTTPLSRIEGWIGFAGSIFDPLWILAVAILAIAWRRPGLRARDSAPWPTLPWAAAAPFLAAALAYLLVLLPLPRDALAARVSFPATVALACALLALFVARPRERRGEAGLAAALGVLIVLQAGVLARDLPALAAPQRAWEAAIGRAASGAEVELPLARARGRTWLARKHRFFIGINADPGHWLNRCYARAMGVGAVRGI